MCFSKKRINTINEFSDIGGVHFSSTDDIGFTFVDYFSDIFKSTTEPTDVNMSDLLGAVNQRLSTEDKQMLLIPYSPLMSSLPWILCFLIRPRALTG